jgi:hypothetical protein
MGTGAVADTAAIGVRHRLRDLGRRERVVAGVIAAMLVAAPLSAVVRFAGDWVATGDTALMGLRSYDSTTSRIPLTGQPSTSGFYGGFRRHAFHPGPMHVYLMAPFVRVGGTFPAMIATSVVIVSASVLVAVWAVFRQLGARAGAVAAAVLGLVMFTTGAGSLVHVVSSNIAGYPLLAGAVLAWCLLCGDDRLLPLAVVVLSFAAQAHLSVAPTVAVLVATGVGALAVTWARAGVRRDPEARRRALRLGGASLAIGLVLWAPVLYQQAIGDPGNLTAVAEFAGDGGRPSLGPSYAVRQLAHVLGLPPLLGRTGLRGSTLIEPVGLLTWVTAAAVVAAVAAAGWRWRREAPRRARLAMLAGLLAAAGFANGSNVPDSIERVRLTFYHWAWPLTLCVALCLALAAGDLARRLGAPPAGARGAGATGVHAWAGPRLVVPLALVTLAVPLVVNPTLERRSNELTASGTMYPRWVIDELADESLAAVGPDEPLVVLTVGGNMFDGAQATFSVRLVEHGRDVSFPLGARDFVADEHLVDIDRPGSVLVLAIGDEPETLQAIAELPGRDVAAVAPPEGGPDATLPGFTVRLVTGDDAVDLFRPRGWLARRSAEAADAAEAF